VTLRTFGEYALRVIDAPKLILNLVGTVDVTNNDAITAWVTQQLLKVTRTAVTTQLMTGAWPILGLSVHSPEIEVMAKQSANAELAEYGISITKLGNVDINLDDDDNARLKKLAGDTAYSRLAGGFLQAAQAEALQGAGEGLAKGGEGASPLFLGAGLGVAGMMQTPMQQAPPPPPGPGFAGGGPGFTQQPQQAPAQAPPATQQAPAPVEDAAPAPAMTECVNCRSPLRAGSKFCPECGTPQQKHCSNCNASLSPTAKFCAECGTPANPPAS
jgi:membrane protease subunit (stomatin/prohibitin family)